MQDEERSFSATFRGDWIHFIRRDVLFVFFCRVLRAKVAGAVYSETGFLVILTFFNTIHAVFFFM